MSGRIPLMGFIKMPCDDMHAWYFAYGSNMSTDQMVERVGRSCIDVPPQVVRLPNYRFAFNVRGEGDIVYANLETLGPGVWGVIYRCDDAALTSLDRFEKGYHRTQVEVFDGRQQPALAFVYLAKPECITHDGRVSDQYLQRILTGARQHALPEEYICQIEALVRSGIRTSIDLHR